MIIGSGYDRGVGGVSGTGFLGGSLPYRSEYRSAGVTPELWLSWDGATQALWLRDYNRPQDQATYYEDSPQSYAYDYVNFIDNATDPTTYTDPIVDFGRSTFTPSRTLILGALVALYLTRS